MIDWSPRAKPKIPPPLPLFCTYSLSLSISLLCSPFLFVAPLSLYDVRHIGSVLLPLPLLSPLPVVPAFSISGRPVYQYIIHMPIIIQSHFLQKFFQFNFFLSLRISHNLISFASIKDRSIRPFLTQTSPVHFILWPNSPYCFHLPSKLFQPFHAAWSYNRLLYRLRFFHISTCNSHCQPFVTASIPYFLFLICYALPPTTVRNHKIDKRNLDGILSYYKLTIIVNHIDFFLSFCILKIKLKNIRTLCIFTTKVELFVLFLSCWISGLPRCLVSYYYNFIF